MVRGLVYTAIYGGRDKPMRVAVPEGNVDYLMFTDTLIPKGWQGAMEPRPQNPRLAARMRKIVLPEQAADYDWALWIDGSHMPKVPIGEHVARWLEEKELAAYKHHHWDCTYTEIKFCKKLGKDKAEKLDACDAWLRRVGFPEHYGQIASTILARRVDSDLVADHAKWWKKAVEERSIRDQVSFMWSLWFCTGEAPAEENLHYIGPNAFRNDLFHYQGGH